jgi:hypothetical protein
MSRPLFSLCMPYYNNPGMLREHYLRWARMGLHTRRDLEVVVCDDASDEPAWKNDWSNFVRLFRIEPPHVMWSQCCATNIAASKANGRWLVITDIDHIVTEETWRALADDIVDEPLDPNKAYRFSRQNVDGSDYKPHPNSWLMTREFFERTGGHDERYRGIYNQDAAFIERVERTMKYANIPQLPYRLIRVGRETIPDASTRGEARAELLLNRKKYTEHAARLRQHFRAEGTYWKDTRFSAAYREIL